MEMHIFDKHNLAGAAIVPMFFTFSQKLQPKVLRAQQKATNLVYFNSFDDRLHDQIFTILKMFFFSIDAISSFFVKKLVFEFNKWSW